MPGQSLNGDPIFSSLGFVFNEIFDQHSGFVHANAQIITSSLADAGFMILVNPNEMEFGTVNAVQLVWPENVLWDFSFISNDNKRYVYSFDGQECMVTETDLNTNMTMQLDTFECTGHWAVPCSATEYIQCRQPLSLEFGCTSGDAETGVLCVERFVVDGKQVNIGAETCTCIEFTEKIDGSLSLQESEDIAILNNAFQHAPGWLALDDVENGFVRLVYPDNTLFFELTLVKKFYDVNGDELPLCEEKIMLRQGAVTVTQVYNSLMDCVITSNNESLLNRTSWCVESDMNGCFLLD